MSCPTPGIRVFYAFLLQLQCPFASSLRVRIFVALCPTVKFLFCRRGQEGRAPLPPTRLLSPPQTCTTWTLLRLFLTFCESPVRFLEEALQEGQTSPRLGTPGASVSCQPALGLLHFITFSFLVSRGTCPTARTLPSLLTFGAVTSALHQVRKSLALEIRLALFCCKRRVFKPVISRSGSSRVKPLLKIII